ncbi:hypothetical protein SteCoe_4819 [Stentor coeruleus]|uniref:Uncharacterized protein n=1 Tax=Stentor coeruleus TaxID=5963 RepID=A0A1R2CTY3_9CILI|nr:hypothetical protein SteCoe_4819 [Stentor coeruleus]
MSSRRLYLDLPLASKYLSERPSLERPSSRTDKLVERSFSSDVPQEGNTPKQVTSSAFKTLSSVGKLKDIMQKTSEKLKSISNRPSHTPRLTSLSNNQSKNESYRISQFENQEKSSELTKLRREIRILEMEKKELENTNKKLQDSLSTCKESSTMSDDSINNLQRYEKFIISAIKDDPIAFNTFKDIFGSEESFLMKINSDNLSPLAFGLMQFVLEILGRPARYSAEACLQNISRQSNMSPCSPIGIKSSEETYSQIYNETQNITNSINEHRKKIQKIYQNVKQTVEISRNYSSSPTLSRPHSSASTSNYNYEKPESYLTLFQKDN